MSKTHWRIAFWLMTALTVGMEVWAANDHNALTETWTEALTNFVPAPILLAVVAWFATWLVQHFKDSTRKKAEREAQAQPLSEALRRMAVAKDGSPLLSPPTDGGKFQFTPLNSSATIKDVENLVRRRPGA